MTRTVVLADDHALFRQGVRALIEPAFTVVGEASDGLEAVEVISSKRPDILLLDVEMPGPSAEKTISRIRRHTTKTAVVILTMHSDAVLKRQLLSAGASLFLNKSIDGAALREAIVTAAPVTTLSPTLAADLPSQILTDRELEVLRMIAQAYTNRDISQRLRITEGTVKRHTSNIYAKLNATSRIDAVRKATRLDLWGTNE